jgi:hypothetical protein
MSLLVIIAGMFLLAKTQKENLSNLFKYVSYFVILVGFLNLFGGGAFFVMKKCMQHCSSKCQDHGGKKDKCHKKNKKACSRMGACEEGEDCEKGGMEMCVEKRIVINGEEMGEGCEKGCEKPCCKGKMMKKDSVVIKH